MTKDRFASSVVVVAGFALSCAASGLAHAQSSPPVPVQPKKVTSGAQPSKSSRLEDAFAGLNYTDEEKAQIEKIRQDTKLRKDAVEKDAKLTADQRDAMLIGYDRLEYGAMYRVLTPAQKAQVREKIHARREADQAAAKKTPPNQVDIK